MERKHEMTPTEAQDFFDEAAESDAVNAPPPIGGEVDDATIDLAYQISKKLGA